VLTFQWDSSEGLSSDGFHTPVYFSKEVLVRYLYDPRFSCDFVSDTYGTIYGSEFTISFGINPDGYVIVWLGDLMNAVPKREQFYWLVENIAPRGNLASEFYDAQINVKFTDPPEAIKCFNAVSKLNDSFHTKFNTLLYKERSIESRIEEARRYKRLIMESQDDFKRFVSEVNEIITENTNNANLRALLASKSIDVPKGSKGNKLLELVFSNLLGDESNRIAPFFYLYDLRLWADHSINQET
jgi:hypothetical protein